MLKKFFHRFWQPPRAHGDIIEDRTVSFLELFYDLVYVVVVATMAHALAHHLSGAAIVEFVVLFGLVWLAWLNGTLYYDLHGHEDIRTRFFVFAQMAILAFLAVYIEEAFTGGPGFALAYAAFMTLLMWLWYTVYQVDQREQIEDAAGMALRYILLIGITVVVMIVSAFLPGEIRLIAWGLLVAMWLVGAAVLIWIWSGDEKRLVMSESTVERFGLFTILVLGEVVVGVVDGLAESDRSLPAMATAFFALIIGFGLWWNYFDRAGRNLPRATSISILWMYLHLPLAMSIAAAGASMISIVEHATDAHPPAIATWLLTGAVALNLLSLAVIGLTLQNYSQMPLVFRPFSFALIIAAGASLLVGFWQPGPLVLVLTLAALLALVWIFLVWRWLVLEDGAE